MTTNFDFLKKNDKNLYEIINDAEKLYRGEFFEQCMTQTRRFGEIVCKNVLGSRRTTEVSFDAMLATLKDCTIGSSEEAREFVEDLYFIKQHRNSATHSVTVKQDGGEALECLQRAFEIAINYCVYSCNDDRKLLKLQYDINLLVTGKKERKGKSGAGKKSLGERYTEAKNKSEKSGAKKVKVSNPENKKKTTTKPQYCSVRSKNGEKKRPYFWYFVEISAVISAVLLIILALI